MASTYNLCRYSMYAQKLEYYIEINKTLFHQYLNPSEISSIALFQGYRSYIRAFPICTRVLIKINDIIIIEFLKT